MKTDRFLELWCATYISKIKSWISAWVPALVYKLDIVTLQLWPSGKDSFFLSLTIKAKLHIYKHRHLYIITHLEYLTVEVGTSTLLNNIVMVSLVGCFTVFDYNNI